MSETELEDYVVTPEQAHQDSFIIQMAGERLEQTYDTFEIGEILCQYASGEITFDKAKKYLEEM